ncbi:MAG: vWA domain-containing protein [Kofleriaceae bacterium]
MIDRQRIATFGIATTAVATVALALWLKPWASGPLIQQPTAVDAHRVDIVFAVDTTGSMGGLLDGAKRTVWSIASHVRELDKNADVHVGLVAYRDYGQGDAYVTKDFAMTGDLDAVFAELSTYQAAGGGDVPEDVDAALDDAVHKMEWRGNAKKMIFLVGDAPPASRHEVPTFDVSSRDAAAKGIIINTIRCGEAQDTAEAWHQIASIGMGEFSTIQQNGGVQQIATPYDQKMAELSKTIDQTTVIYGDAATRGAYEGKMEVAHAAAPAAMADRAAYYGMAKGGGARAKEDVVGGVATGAVAVESLDPSKLPDDMKDKSKDEIKADFEARAKKRAQAQTELQAMAKQRADYLKAHEKEAGDGFDVKVKATVERELSK